MYPDKHRITVDRRDISWVIERLNTENKYTSHYIETSPTNNIDKYVELLLDKYVFPKIVLELDGEGSLIPMTKFSQDFIWSIVGLMENKITTAKYKWKTMPRSHQRKIEETRLDLVLVEIYNNPTEEDRYKIYNQLNILELKL